MPAPIVKTYQGKKYWVDPETNNVLDVYIEPENSKPVKAPATKTPTVNVSPEAQIQPTMPLPAYAPPVSQDLAQEAQQKSAPGTFMRNLALESIPAFAGAGGQAIGGVPGNFLATIAGVAAQRELKERLGLQNTGDPNSEAQNVAEDVAMNFGSDMVGGGVANALVKGSKLATKAGRLPYKENIARRLLAKGSTLQPETRAFIASEPDFPITLGQIKGKGSNLSFFEDLLGKEDKMMLEGVQQDRLQKKLTGEVEKRSPSFVKVVNDRIANRNTNFHATSGSNIFDILDKGLDSNASALGQTSVSRTPGINLERYNGITLEFDPPKGYKPVAERNYGKKGTGFEFENRGEGKIKPEQFKRAILNRDSMYTSYVSKDKESELVLGIKQKTPPTEATLALRKERDALKEEYNSFREKNKEHFKLNENNDYNLPSNIKSKNQQYLDKLEAIQQKEYDSTQGKGFEEYYDKVKEAFKKKGIPIVEVANAKELRGIRTRTAEANPSEINATRAQGNIATGYERMRGLESRTWDQTRELARSYKQRFQGPATEVDTGVLDANGQPMKMMKEGSSEVIEGPINPMASREFANEILSGIKKAYNLNSTEDLFGAVAEEQKGAITLLGRIAESKGPIPMDVAIDLKRITGSKGFRNSIPNGVQEGMFRKLNSGLDADIETSIQGWDSPLKDHTLRQFRRAKALTTKKAQIFKDMSEVENLRSTPYSGTQEMKAILRDPNTVRNAIRGAKDRPEMRKTLQAEWLADTQSRASENGQFVGTSDILNRALDREHDGVFQSLFSPAEQTQIRSLFTTIKDLSSGVGNEGQRNLAMREVSNGISFSGALLQMISKGEMKPLLSASGKQLAGIVGGKSFIKNVALNPQVARAAMQLQKVSPESPRAKALAKVVFGALRGTEILLTTPEGEQRALIDKNAELQMLSPE